MKKYCFRFYWLWLTEWYFGLFFSHCAWQTKLTHISHTFYSFNMEWFLSSILYLFYMYIIFLLCEFSFSTLQNFFSLFCVSILFSLFLLYQQESIRGNWSCIQLECKIAEQISMNSMIVFFALCLFAFLYFFVSNNSND